MAWRFFELALGCLWLVHSAGCEETRPISPQGSKTSGEASVDHPKADGQRIDSSYVGSSACAECHADVMREYQGHPMSQSLSLTHDSLSAEDLQTAKFSPRENLEYYVEQDATGTWHHEKLMGVDGKEIYDQRMPVAVSVGSGARGRSYLINSSGRLYASPITWYTEDAHWGLSPGYPPEFHERFERRVTHSCLSCHAGRVNPHDTDLNRFAEPLFSEESIGCERCHGPGESHINFQRTSVSLRSGSDPIVNPEKLKDSRRDAVCNQCHLQGHRRVLRNERTEFDFRPGMHLSDMWTVFLKTSGVKSGNADAVSQTEQMYSSTCFQKSNGELACISCHDPHRLPARDEASAFYRQRCLQCHSNGTPECSEDIVVRRQHSNEDSCIDCHMPHFAAADVHSAQTDHRILRRQPAAVAEEGIPTERDHRPLVLFEESGATLSQSERDRATGIFMAEKGYLGNDLTSARSAAQLLGVAYKANPNDLEVAFSLGKSLIALGRTRDGSEVLLHVLKLQPRHEEALETLATACHESGQLKLAMQYYQRLLEVNPDNSRYYGRYAHVAGQLGDFPAAISAAEKSLTLNPSLLQAHTWLSEAYMRLGDAEKSQFHKNKMRSIGTPEPSRQD